jgi:FKBP-type peptidyl-prolyl cis-trans isomerase FkpA
MGTYRTSTSGAVTDANGKSAIEPLAVFLTLPAHGGDDTMAASRCCRDRRRQPIMKDRKSNAAVDTRVVPNMITKSREVSTVAVAVLGLALAGLAACQRNEPAPAADQSAAAAAWVAISEMQMADIVEGAGAAASTGSAVEVHYDGWLYDPATADHRGTKFDSSRDRGQPFRFQIDSGAVIKGWDQGVTGMKVGGKRQLIIPSRLGYGERGAGGGVIPPGAALVFEVELLRIE